MPPKTDDSERTIPLPGICEDALIHHRSSQEKEKAEAGEDWRDYDLVFPLASGHRWNRTTCAGARSRIRTRAGLDDVRLPDTRHTCVSLLLCLGVPPHTVREIVGHSDIEVTMTIYTHTALDEM